MNSFHVTECASTMDEARALIDKGEKIPFYLFADRQLKGRGQYGKNWESYEGNLFLSVVMNACDVKAPGLLSLTVGLSVAEALAEKGLRPNLVWPNDVLIDGAKTAGILIEEHGGAFIAGIGLNLNLPAGPTVLEDGRLINSVSFHTGSPEAKETWSDLLAESILQRIKLGEEAILPTWRGFSQPHTVGEMVK
ncbi:biotin--[bacterium]|nr:biotin--[acetyl-CoA-carboxylase] ligase [bacterium]